MRKRTNPAASHPSPELMELRETEPFGPTDHDRVCTRDIETALHDVGCQQNVRRAFNEARHSVVYFVDGQLAVETDDAEIRGHGLHSRQHWREILYSRTDQKALPPASVLAQQCCGNCGIRKGRDLRDDRDSMNGRGGNDAEIPEARETSGESPRNRRGAHPKGMDTLGQLGKLRLL